MKFHTLIAATVLLGIAGCGGGGDDDPPTNPPPPAGSSSSSGGGLPNPASAPALKTVLATRYGVVNYPVGAAIEPASLNNADEPVIRKHYSSLTAENAMKPDTIWPNAPGSTTQPGTQNFAPADAIANYALANNIRLRGHTLLWHQTVPSWLVSGADLPTIQQNMRNYIFAVVQRYPEVYAWDVVNEAASDTPNAANPYRTDSPWYQAYAARGAQGSQYVRDAFLFATQARAAVGRNDTNMKLMLNDYNTELSGKRANVIAIVQDIQLAGTGADIDGVGHQFHLQVDANVNDVVAAFTAVEALPGSLVNHVTELDVSIYADPGACYAQRTIPPCLADYGTSPPANVMSQQATLYRALFNAFNRASVTSVTTWGIGDNHTWLNSFPVNRTNRPLLFDTSVNPKSAFWAVVDPAFTIP